MKAVSWLVSDAHMRKLGEQTGLDTLVVLAVNDDHSTWEGSTPSVSQANAVSGPPEEYERKLKIQRN